MPHLFSGLNQKRQSGVITGGTFTVGNTKGRGSTTRMLNYCTQHSEAQSDCIDQFISVAPPPPPPPPIEENILFDLSTFNNFSIPEIYKSPLISAANRWNQFIKFNTDFIELIRTITLKFDPTNAKWKGIRLTKFTLVDNTDFYAATITHFQGYTSFNTSFELEINKNKVAGFSYTELYDTLTHELGHCLGMAQNLDVRLNAKSSGALLLPNIQQQPTFKNSPNETPIPISLIYNSFPALNAAYNDYNGTVEYDGSSGKTVPGTWIPIDSSFNENGFHLNTRSIQSKELVDPSPPYNTSKYAKRGFYNEIMNSSFVKNQRRWISWVTLGFYYDLYTSWQNKKYYNYTSIDPYGEVYSVSYIRQSYSMRFNVSPPQNSKGFLIDNTKELIIKNNKEHIIEYIDEDINEEDIIYLKCICCKK
jgi:hypothetical protein